VIPSSPMRSRAACRRFNGCDRACCG
jgi:hypothetical protein